MSWFDELNSEDLKKSSELKNMLNSEITMIRNVLEVFVLFTTQPVTVTITALKEIENNNIENG